MTKEEIIGKYKPNGEYPSYYHESNIEQMLDEYAKSQAISFIEYHEKFRREEGRWAGQAYKKAGGIFSWVGEDTSKIYDAFVEKKPIKSYLIPDQETFWQYDDNGRLIHSSDKSQQP